MHKLIRVLFVTLLFYGIAPNVQAKNIDIIVTIKPLYSLVANVMGDRLKEKGNKLHLIIDGGLDPHIFRLKPSDIRNINHADVLFYIDPNMETFLNNILINNGPNFKAVALAQQEGIHLIPYRTHKVWNEEDNDVAPNHHQEPDHHHHGNNTQDLHIWLEPANARRMVHIIEKTLSDLDPEHHMTYAHNAAKTITRLSALEVEIRQELRPVHDKPIIVYHDAFQYYEKAFDLKTVGAIVLKPDQTPSAKHILTLKNLVIEKKVTCILAAPRANPRIAHIITRGTKTGFRVVDPLGRYQEKGPDLYFDMMKQIARAIVDCQKETLNQSLE